MNEKYRKEVKVGRYKISYYQQGHGDCLVLLHGFLNSAVSYRHVFKTLAVRGRVIVPDLPGSGKSGKPLKFNYSLDNLADFLAAFLDELKIKTCVLGGASTGGALALRFALKYPERLEKLLLIDSAGLKKAGRGDKAFLNLPMDQELSADPSDLLKLYLRQFSHDEAVTVEQRMKYLETMTDRASLRCAEKIIKANGMFAVEGISGINLPTLIVWGERDRVLAESNASKFVKKIPGSRYVMIPEAGHLPHEESPEDFNTVLLDFLKGDIPRAV
jgi:pimeloyl-ACP methyl ester carboxylesterase